jgi:hypothetical protein
LPLIQNKPTTMKDGTRLTYFSDSVGQDGTSYSFEKEQEWMVLENKGTADITVTIGLDSYVVIPSKHLTINQPITEFSVKSAAKTQHFSLLADQTGVELPAMFQSLGGGHSHNNKDTLDQLSDNGTNLLYKGSPISGVSGGTSGVASVNGMTGSVTLTASSVGAAPSSHVSDSNVHVTYTEKTTWNNKAEVDHTHTAAQITESSTKRFVTDSEKSTWNGKASSSHTHNASEITTDLTHRFVTDEEKTTWDSKASSDVATQQKAGLMSAADKLKLDTIDGSGQVVESGVSSVNNKTGDVTLTASDVGAAPSGHVADTTVHITATERSTWNAKVDEGHTHLASDITENTSKRFVSDTEKTTWNAKSNFSGSYNDLTDQPIIPTIENVRSASSQALLVEVRTSDPTTPAVGQIWLRSDL